MHKHVKNGLRAVGAAVLGSGLLLATLAGGGVGAQGAVQGGDGAGLSFTTSGAGNTAGLQPGTNHAGGLLHVASVAPGSNAVVHIAVDPPGELTPVTPATFTASSPQGYISGSADPRLEIQPGGKADSFANDITGFPAMMNGKSTGECFGTAAVINGVCFFQNNTGEPSWAAVRSYLDSNGGVQQAYIVQDAESTILTDAPYDVTIGSLTWDGQVLLPEDVANQVTAKDLCGSYAARHWKITNLGPAASRGLRYRTRLNSGAWSAMFSATVTSSVIVVTHSGRTLQVFWGDGLGHQVSAQFPVTTAAACA